MNKGLTSLLISIIIFVVVVGFIFLKNFNILPTQLSIVNNQKSAEVSWQFGDGKWSASGNPPECPSPLTFPAPVDISLVSGILYPGQERGSDYKPHGGFRFDNRDNNIQVRAIMDGYILKASRYEDFGGEIQNFLFYVNDCGIMVMHDHLLILSPKLQAVFDKLPLNKNGDSRTTYISPKVYIKKGEVLALKIGYEKFPGGYKNKNVFVDFGLYDLRKTNGIDYNSLFLAKHPNINEYGKYAVCWFDYLSIEDEATVRNLPASGNEGKMSDYCK
ncbi:MAG: hypothetical protein HZC02_05365 [Candidatus Levybacteria bacterium]|nr:hypothetical protein [Candidatus Levybacteria bacterium]